MGVVKKKKLLSLILTDVTTTLAEVIFRVKLDWWIVYFQYLAPLSGWRLT